MRRYLLKPEILRFVQSYVYEKPLDVVAAMLAARPDLSNLNRRLLMKHGEVILSNSTVNSMISEEFARILKEEGIDNVKKKFLDTLIQAEKIAIEKEDTTVLLSIAKIWGQMSAEYGLKQTITATGTGKLSEDILNKLENGKIKISKKITNEGVE